jgi:hypothetical protein
LIVYFFYQGVSFRIDEVELDPELRRVYNKAVDLWVEMLHKFTEAADLIGKWPPFSQPRKLNA